MLKAIPSFCSFRIKKKVYSFIRSMHTRTHTEFTFGRIKKTMKKRREKKIK